MHEGYKESDWFNNDAFWWSRSASDWAYSAEWAGEGAKDHPIYVPAHRYARNIIVSLNSGVTGWIDWNVVLDHEGGPNHVGNFCGAPIMVNRETKEVYYTPIYTILAQFSRTIRPGDRGIKTERRFKSISTDSYMALDEIFKKASASEKTKVIVVDDFQYFILNYYTNFISGEDKSKKFDKYDELGKLTMNLFNKIKQLRDDQKVFDVFAA